MTFNRDLVERVWRAFYTSALAVGVPLVSAHLSGIVADVASGNWQALHSVAVTIGTAALSAGVTAVKALIGRGVGVNPEDGSLKGALNGNGK